MYSRVNVRRFGREARGLSGLATFSSCPLRAAVTSAIDIVTSGRSLSRPARGSYTDIYWFILFHISLTERAPVPPAEAIRDILSTLALPTGHIPSNLDAQAALYRSVLASRQMLVILDNARDADQVRPLLPGSPGSLVIVTSRNQLTSLIAAEDARPLTVGLLTEAEARELIVCRIGARRLAAEPVAAAELLAMCARLPLAVCIMTARAASPGLPSRRLDLRAPRRAGPAGRA
ncbi:MAG TPA: NB-ARC domain-containing protein [Streptosporangiaceae bacterium]